MEGYYYVNGRFCHLSLSNDILCLKKISMKGIVSEISEISIQVNEILSVVYENNTSRPLVTIHHVVSHSDGKLRREILNVDGELDACDQLANHIDDLLKELTRPKRLLIFVNPKSGHKKGVKIYTTKVLPLLKLCNIHTDCIVTKRSGQPKELLASYDLSLVHGIVSVGGDGLFSECVNGLLERLQVDSHVDMHDPDSAITASKIPIGIVPAGSGNYLVNYIHGTRDIETAVLKIILGDHHLSNVVSVHQGRKLTCYASLLVEFGLIGNMMHDCEKFRWMGPSRYNIIPIATLAKRKQIDVEIEYLPEDTPKNSPRNSLTKYQRQVSLPAKHFNNRFIQRMNSSPEDFKQKSKDWKKLDGQVYGVDTYVVTQKEKGDSLVAKFGDDALTLWTTEKCSMSKHVEQLTKLQKAQSGFLDYDFVRQVRTTRYRVKLPSARFTMDDKGNRCLVKKYYINADGEDILLTNPEFEVRLHHHAMPIYGRVEG